jgi:two-component sensor histidine kinase
MSETIEAPIPGATPGSRLLVEEIGHRVANEYAAAIGSLSLAAARCSNAEAKRTLAGVAGRLLDYADAHRALLPPRAAGPVDLGPYLRAACRAIVRARLAERRIALTLVEASIALEAEQCWRVGMIVAELVGNAARHGLGDREGAIEVALAARDGAVHCRVRDDGAAADPKPGRGTQIAQALARELGGRIEWDFGASGTTALLIFPHGRPASSLAA